MSDKTLTELMDELDEALDSAEAVAAQGVRSGGDLHKPEAAWRKDHDRAE